MLFGFLAFRERRRSVLLKQTIIVRVSANPEPGVPIGLFGRQGAVAQANTH
jgi:hypothetical protein